MIKHALHGFLGLPTDWSFIDSSIAYNLMSNESLAQNNLKSWATWFNSKQTESPKILIGYSLGGRFALHALIQNPNMWNGAVIISAHPGLTSLPERQMRLEHDYLWAKRFVTERKEDVIHDWNQQPVFAFDPPYEVQDDNFDRSKLFKAMTQWSLGRQQDLRLQIAQLDIPILWITGENDQKFRNLAKEVTLSHAKSHFWIAPQVGHRVHCVQHENLMNRINEFEESLC